MTDRFKSIASGRKGCALILAGSDSDQPHIEKIINSLEKYGVPYEVRICSAHKQPEKLTALINECNQIDGSFAIIAVAGGTDVLSGTLSFHTMNPVISCPPDSPNSSCLTNPPGSSNAAIFNPGNAGRFVAQIYAPFNPEIRSRLLSLKEKKINKLESKDKEFQKKYRKV